MTEPIPIGIGHLTMLDIAPPDWVTLAHEAGFDAVGIRAAVAGPGEEPWPISPGSPMLAETLARLRDTGVRVLDTEIIRLTPETTVAEHRPLFEVGAELGARFVNLIPADPDLKRSADNIAAIAEEAATYGLRLSFEAMSYAPVGTLDDAIRVVEGSSAGIIMDPLHLQRSDTPPERLRSVDPELWAFYQVCDGPRKAPSGLPRPTEMPRGQSVDNANDLQLEARTMRLLPGEGEFPLREYLDALPPGRPISAEVPNLALQWQLGPLEFAKQIRAAVGRLLETTAA